MFTRGHVIRRAIYRLHSAERRVFRGLEPFPVTAVVPFARKSADALAKGDACRRNVLVFSNREWRLRSHGNIIFALQKGEEGVKRINVVRTLAIIVSFDRPSHRALLPLGLKSCKGEGEFSTYYSPTFSTSFRRFLLFSSLSI